MASFWWVFRLIFVFFSLYLMGDAFYRWDGFSYYAPFSEFMFGFALVTVLWSIVALFISMFIWLAGRILHYFGGKFQAEHLLIFIGFFGLFGAITWKVKRFFFLSGFTMQSKLVVFMCVILAAVLLTLFSRNKAKRWIEIIQERIAPLLWLFGAGTVVSVFMVAFLVWGEQANDAALQETARSETVDTNRPNIILLTFDALTARDMSVYGYSRKTTPFISEWAKNASLFTKAEAESNLTTPATASLMTGKRVWTHQTYHLVGSKPINSDTENLAYILKNNGYHNISYIENAAATIQQLGIERSFHNDLAASRIKKSKLQWKQHLRSASTIQGFVNTLLWHFFGDKIRLYNWIVLNDFKPSTILNFINPIYHKLFISKRLKIKKDNISNTDNKNNKDDNYKENNFKSHFKWIMSIIDDKPPEPFFAWIHLLPPHDYYLPGEPFIGIFDSSSEYRAGYEQDKTLNRIRTHIQFSQEDQRDIKILRARYDEYILYCDDIFKTFIEQLERKNILKNTVIVLSSDHGESFEHDYQGYGSEHLYEQVTHIPLIIKTPGQRRGRIIDDLVKHIDIPVTILHLAGIDKPSWMEGRSLVPLLNGRRLPSIHRFSMSFQRNRSVNHQITKGTIAVWENNYKLIHYLNKEKSFIFDMKEDPDELNNLNDREPDIAQRLLSHIKTELMNVNEAMKAGE